MPAKERRIHSSLIDSLDNEPHRFEFFQAVRMLLAHHRQNSNGKEADALEHIVRFRNSVSLAFPPSEIESMAIEWEDAEESESKQGRDMRKAFKRVTLVPSFMGLTGPSGVLPRHYTQHVAEREIYHRDTATRAFLDIFTTRAVSLFYQSWLKYRLYFQYEADRKQRFLPLVLSLAGLGLLGMRERLTDRSHGMADESLAYYASALRNRPQSVEWFSRIVGQYFQVPCQVEQFVGQWLDLPPQEHTRLGMSNCALGQTSFCGDRIWDRQSKVRLTIGPLRKKQFDEFLPRAAASANLRRLFRLMVGTTLDCEVRLVLDKRDVTVARLDSQSGFARLGWSAWCKSTDIRSDSCDTAYLMAAAGSIN